MVEQRDAQKRESETADPVDVAGAAVEPPSWPDPNRATVHRAAHVVREQHRTVPQRPAETTEPMRPTPRPREVEQGRDASPSEPDRPRRGLVGPMSKVRTANVESTAPAQRRPGLREDTGILREPVRISPAISPRTASTPTAPPRIEVNIGRVEVRAVYAPPSPSPARKPASPPVSLDDYLKQRDGTR
jgi:hypothetical protein